MTFARRIALGLLLAVGLSFAFAILVSRRLRENQEATDTLVTRGQRALQLTTLLERLVVDMESGVRGFGTTGDQAFLEPYEKAQGAYRGAHSELRRLLEVDELRALSTLDDSVQTWRTQFAEPRIAFARSHPPRVVDGERIVADPGAGLGPEAGKRSMAVVRARFDRLMAAEQGRVARGVRAVADSQRRVVRVLWSTACVFALAVGAAAVGLVLAHRRGAELDRFFSLSIELLCIAGFDGRFKKVNPAWSRLLGYPLKEIAGRPFLDFVHPDDRAGTEAEAARLASGEDTIFFENRYRCRDGSYRWLAWSATPVLSLELIYATARDVTEGKRMEAELQRRAGELEEANQELEAFSYSVSHDLRAPLRHVDGFARLLSRRAERKLDDKERHYLATISDAARRMGTLIDDLLSFSRVGRAELRRVEVDLEALVNDVRRELMEAGTRRIEWEIAPLPRVEGDPALLRLVLANLLGNAVKYTSGRDPAHITVGSRRNETGETVIFVRDDGAGFDKRYAGKLFGVFQRLHLSEDFEGTGIGLANVKRIVERHGGKVWAEGVPDEGATFSFTLPSGKESV